MIYVTCVLALDYHESTFILFETFYPMQIWILSTNYEDSSNFAVCVCLEQSDSSIYVRIYSLAMGDTKVCRGREVGMGVLGQSV